MYGLLSLGKNTFVIIRYEVFLIMWGRVIGWLVPDVSRQRGGLVFKDRTEEVAKAELKSQSSQRTGLPLEMKKYAARVPALELSWQSLKPLHPPRTPFTKRSLQLVLGTTTDGTLHLGAVCLSAHTARPTHLWCDIGCVKIQTQLWLSGTSRICHKFNKCVSFKRRCYCVQKNLLQSATISSIFIHKPNKPIQSSNFIFITRYSTFTINSVPAYTECSNNDRVGFWRRPPQLTCTTIKLMSHKVHLQSPTGRHGYVHVPYSLRRILLVHTRRTVQKAYANLYMKPPCNWTITIGFMGRYCNVHTITIWLTYCGVI
jgi:hypothetical protein